MNRGFSSSIGLSGVSCVRASGDTPERLFFHRLEGKRGGFLLGEPFRRRPVLRVPARPLRSARRHPVPTRPWYVWVLDSTGKPLVKWSLCSSIGLNRISLVRACG